MVSVPALWWQLDQMALQPRRNVGSSEDALGQVENELFLLFYRSFDLEAVQHQEDFHGRMADSFVAINERVILDQRRTQCSRLVSQRWLKVDPVKSGTGLCDGRLKEREIAESRTATSSLKHGPMQGEYLAQCEVPHYASRRYSSWFFDSTRSTAAANCLS